MLQGASMDLSDAELLLACQKGDEAAWDTLVGRYQGLLYTVARRAGLSPDLAAEVFQRVFAALVEQLDRIEHPERIGAWLVTTARREAWRARQGERAVVLANERDLELQAVPDDLAPDEMLMRLEERDAVRAALDVLEGRCRRLLIMLFTSPEPPSYAEVAAALHMSEGSIGPTRARCLEKLRRLLEALDS